MMQMLRSVKQRETSPEQNVNEDDDDVHYDDDVEDDGDDDDNYYDNKSYILYMNINQVLEIWMAINYAIEISSRAQTKSNH